MVNATLAALHQWAEAVGGNWRSNYGPHERRRCLSNWSASPYFFLVPMPSLFPNGLFIEVRLFDDDPQDPWVEIVNAHPQV